MPRPEVSPAQPRSLPGTEVAVGALWPPTWPMSLTVLRLLLLPVFLWLLILDAGPDEPSRDTTHRWWALGVFGVMALTDQLDGFLARRLNQISRLGTILDPLADKLLVGFSIILLSSKWIAAPGFHIPGYVVFTVYAKDAVVVLGMISLRRYLLGRMDVKPRILSKAGTFLQLVLVMAVLMAPDLYSVWPGGTVRSLDALQMLVAIVAYATTVDYVILGIRHYFRVQADDLAAIGMGDKG